jgi:murein DD-endopeptidase MepM/ murein hydrolase activator NlpD
MTDLIFSDGTSARIAPNLNAGTVGIQYLLAQLYTQPEWETMMYGESGLIPSYNRLFGDAFARAKAVEPLFTADTSSPILELPFAPSEKWALTGGLHEDWTAGTPWGAMDFAPLTGEGACVVSKAWVLAAAPGRITRASNNQVIIALQDEMGNPTGWEVFYMHIAKEEMVAEGTLVKLDDRIGHPSCQGGSATGTHFHIARKYKGEWIGADGPFPFTLSGWLAIPGDKLFVSTLVKNDRVVKADPNGVSLSQISR